MLYVALLTVVKVRNAVPWMEASRSLGPVPEPENASSYARGLRREGACREKDRRVGISVLFVESAVVI